jgi:hypothetical protein
MSSGAAMDGAMKKILGAGVAAVMVLGAILAVNAARLGSRQIDVARNDEASPPVLAAAQRLAQAVRF